MNSTLQSNSRQVYTLVDFGQRNPSFPPGVMRNLIWKAQDRESSLGLIKGNGLDRAVVRIGRRVYVDENRFYEWLDQQQKMAGSQS